VDAVVYYTTENASGTIHAKIFNDADFAGFPEKGVGGTGFDTQLAFYASTGFHVDGHGSFFEILFDAH
jgi:hypothetical protein